MPVYNVAILPGSSRKRCRHSAVSGFLCPAFQKGEMIYGRNETRESIFLCETLPGRYDHRGLEKRGIPAYSQSDGSGEYMEIYMGTSLFGENIYVDENDARRAEEIIRGITLPADDSEDLSDSSAIPDARQR